MRQVRYISIEAVDGLQPAFTHRSRLGFVYQEGVMHAIWNRAGTHEQ